MSSNNLKRNLEIEIEPKKSEKVKLKIENFRKYNLKHNSETDVEPEIQRKLSRNLKIL